MIGCYAAGDVVEVGSDVTSVSVGDRVMPSIFPRWLDGPFAFNLADQLGGSRDGVLSEYLVIDAASLVMVPPHLLRASSLSSLRGGHRVECIDGRLRPASR